jgi:hypothetical protein
MYIMSKDWMKNIKMTIRYKNQYRETRYDQTIQKQRKGGKTNYNQHVTWGVGEE